MRAFVTGLLVSFGAVVTAAHAQEPAPRFWLAPFGTASLNDWPTPSHERLGVRIALPFLERLTFYPAVEIEPEIAFSQAFLDLRLQPLGTRGPALSGTWVAGLRRREITPGLISSPARSDPLDHSGRLLSFTSSVTLALLRSIYRWGSRSQSPSSCRFLPTNRCCLTSA